MNARNLLPPSIGLLGLLGILGMLASMLACRPSWSPDGSKILFPYYDPETGDVPPDVEFGVAAAPWPA